MKSCYARWNPNEFGWNLRRTASDEIKSASPIPTKSDFIAKRFHPTQVGFLPPSADLVEKSTHCLDRQMCAFFWRRRWDLNPRDALTPYEISSHASSTTWVLLHIRCKGCNCCIIAYFSLECKWFFEYFSNFVCKLTNKSNEARCLQWNPHRAQASIALRGGLILPRFVKQRKGCKNPGEFKNGYYTFRDKSRWKPCISSATCGGKFFSEIFGSRRMWNNFLAEIVKYLPSVDVK